MVGMIFSGKLHRWERCCLPDLFRNDLIDRCIQMNDISLGRNGSAEERGAADGMTRLACVIEASDDVHLVPEFLERFQNRREFKPGALLCRRPGVHDRAVRYVEESK